MDWRYGAQGVLVEYVIAVDRAIRGRPDAIVHGRRWQHLNLVLHTLYTFNVLDRFFSVGALFLGLRRGS
ncbi:MAG TPA: hypothetical protein VEV41_18215 [Terriglobales bacterium]|nr:hypothetical protein [Terriglobales bacterium]